MTIVSGPDQDKIKAFGAELHQTITESPFGSLSKSELELAYFSALVKSGIIALDGQSNFDLARTLRCTPTRASNLVFNYRLRSSSTDDERSLQKKLAEATSIAKDLKNSESGNVTLNVEDRFWRGELVNRMKRLQVFTDTSFNRERLVLDAETFIEHCPALFGDAGRELQKSVKEQAKDPKSFSNTIQSILSNVIEGAEKGAGSMSIAALMAAGVPGLT